MQDLAKIGRAILGNRSQRFVPRWHGDDPRQLSHRGRVARQCLAFVKRRVILQVGLHMKVKRVIACTHHLTQILFNLLLHHRIEGSTHHFLDRRCIRFQQCLNQMVMQDKGAFGDLGGVLIGLKENADHVIRHAWIMRFAQEPAKIEPFPIDIWKTVFQEALGCALPATVDQNNTFTALDKITDIGLKRLRAVPKITPHRFGFRTLAADPVGKARAWGRKRLVIQIHACQNGRFVPHH